METKGVVIKSTGNCYIVKQDNGEKIICNLKGNFKIKGIKTTNPVAVGDRVLISCADTQAEDTGLITKILDRKNYIIRRATNLSKISHIVAANVDTAFLVVTLVSPKTSIGFIDRFLVTAEAYSIPVVIVFNKIDMYDDETINILENLIKLYESVGYTCVKVSAMTGSNVDMLKSLMKDKSSLFSGHSGVGKSTLLNVIQPDLKLKTGEISMCHDKGKHVTTFAEMHTLSFGGYIIDTPGIKEFGLIDFRREEVSHYFPEMRQLMNKCRFDNCTHLHEPNCAVKDALDRGQINPLRYKSYLSILNKEQLEKEYND